MKVEVIEKKREPQPTPFVVGGVYKSKSMGGYRILTLLNGDYRMVDINEGTLGYFLGDNRSTAEEIVAENYDYVPNAKLIVEVDA